MRVRGGKYLKGKRSCTAVLPGYMEATCTKRRDELAVFAPRHAKDHAWRIPYVRHAVYARY